MTLKLQRKTGCTPAINSGTMDYVGAIYSEVPYKKSKKENN